ncbi:MAG: plasmid stabilization system [Candidatus Woesebacteria bacterium GW2011_GWB1_38_5b]|uniref:Plasmid stabilization system n=1 Tax=Candidatus Woesebacteria bacterium GW2011_GWB1_38_5b TaxID=1618569 RepID=A0A0G0KAS7_9BACT|nr:MAG: plasmid stabilization system [Candidatus Woesebacteria bacterium GW2011_GWB1_38_5b]
MRFEFSRSAEKELSKLNKGLGQRIYKKIVFLAKNPKLVKSTKLKGEDSFRIRIGDYRVVYIIEERTIVVIKIRHRRDVYKF